MDRPFFSLGLRGLLVPGGWILGKIIELSKFARFWVVGEKFFFFFNIYAFIIIIFFLYLPFLYIPFFFFFPYEMWFTHPALPLPPSSSSTSFLLLFFSFFFFFTFFSLFSSKLSFLLSHPPPLSSSSPPLLLWSKVIQVHKKRAKEKTPSPPFLPFMKDRKAVDEEGDKRWKVFYVYRNVGNPYCYSRNDWPVTLRLT